MKKDQNLPNKNIHSNNSSRKPLPNNTPITLDNNHPTIQMIEDNHHTKQIRKISHKTDIVNHIVEIVSIKITIQTNPNFRLMPDAIQILKK